ncbi:PREDICTED: nuclear protein MDM1 isoform X2 [Elephantulus edwardii]|uniref:nuclear protein MDM1 isoform X2 n=1 Tax=Elephantulus edwardii TaxID=28737 RepID=UPI0003F05CF9|nr:PREDICTED: nuclear protein MDM1 isoform X2 [Elephantulus edwardii]
MPVRFKGLSEYQRNFLWKNSYLSECRNPSVAQKYPLAGLRSDQLGITKEPSFISKRRVAYHDPQISKSLEWNGSTSENNMAASPESEAPPILQEAEQKDDVNPENIVALDVPKVLERNRLHSVLPRDKGVADLVENKEDVLAKCTPVNEDIEPKHSAKPLSDKVDNGVFHNKSKFVPQFKGNSTIHETEYKRNFKGLSPVKEPKLRNDLKENGNLETQAPEKKCHKGDPIKPEAEMEAKNLNQPKKKLTPWRHQRLGKVNSEYRAKFLSPAQYLYKAGAWTRVKENVPNQASLNAMWYAEVKELREKAEFYRKRVLGTHFSRDHLNQILSDNNYCWDVSSTTSSEGTISSNIRALDLAGGPANHKTLQKCPSTKLEEKRPVLEEQSPKYATEKLGVSDAPTMPVRRRLAWDADNTNEDTQKQPRGKEEEEEEEMERDKQVYREDLEKLDVKESSKFDKIKEGSDSSSLSSVKGGRLPTPKLKELGGAQRTHHDLTTPAVGGAVLVSPSKMKPEQRKKLTPQDGLETPKNDFSKKAVHTVPLLTSPAAGKKTVDPLPLREDSETNIATLAEETHQLSKIPESPASTPGQCPSPPYVPFYSQPSLRIKGTLRDPEFQHNVGKARMNNFQLPQQDAFNDEDDRLSEISARSAASSLRAFQTLTRARKRKENFWGKT